MANDLVVKSNTLINASYSLTLAEQRLIGLAIVKANNQHKEVDPNTMLVVTALEYMEQFNVDRATAYEALKEASERLFSRYFTYDVYSRENGKEYDLKPPKKLSSSNGGEKVFKISYSPIKLLVMRVISDFIIDKVRGSKFRNSFSKKVMEESKS